MHYLEQKACLDCSSRQQNCNHGYTLKYQLLKGWDHFSHQVSKSKQIHLSTSYAFHVLRYNILSHTTYGGTLVVLRSILSRLHWGFNNDCSESKRMSRFIHLLAPAWYCLREAAKSVKSNSGNAYSRQGFTMFKHPLAYMYSIWHILLIICFSAIYGNLFLFARICALSCAVV